jgi:hypothetical protein
MTFLLKRGKGALRRVVHLTTFDHLTGELSMRPLCGRSPLRFDMTSNVPWGRPLCKRCRKIAEEHRHAG